MGKNEGRKVGLKREATLPVEERFDTYSEQRSLSFQFETDLQRGSVKEGSEEERSDASEPALAKEDASSGEWREAVRLKRTHGLVGRLVVAEANVSVNPVHEVLGRHEGNLVIDDSDLFRQCVDEGVPFLLGRAVARFVGPDCEG